MASITPFNSSVATLLSTRFSFIYLLPCVIMRKSIFASPFTRRKGGIHMKGTPSTRKNTTDNTSESTAEPAQKPSITYVLDTNVLIDYPEIIPNGSNFRPESQTIDFTGAHIVIPTAVTRELSNHKKEQSDRGVACRAVLKRLRNLMEKHDLTMFEAYNLENPLYIRDGSVRLSILPVAKDFKKHLPFAPSEEDMDGQIILATLATFYLKNGIMKIDGSSTHFPNHNGSYPTITYSPTENQEKVILVTSDNELITRAHARGIETASFSYKIPAPYTGRRDLIVPAEMFEKFYLDHRLDRTDWEFYMPHEPPLVDNEFLIMYPENNAYPGAWRPDYDPEHFSYIGRYDEEFDCIFPLTFASNLDVEIKNPGQAIYAEALMDPKITAVICTGPAGTGKTYMATIFAYNAYKTGKYVGISVVPCQTENTYGYLPGDLDEKLDPNVLPIKRALKNYLLETDKTIRKKRDIAKKYGNSDDFLDEEDDSEGDEKESRKDLKKDPDRDFKKESKKSSKKSLKAYLDSRVKLIWDNWFGPPIPIENARGNDFRDEIALFDEFQDQNRTQAQTLLTRLGTGGKMIITGDIEQIHAAYLDKDNNGLTFARNLLKGLPGVAQVTFTEDEVVRSTLVQAIIQRLNSPNSSR